MQLPRKTLLLSTLAALSACGDDAVDPTATAATTDASTSTTATTNTTSTTATPTTDASTTQNPTSTGTMGGTEGSSSGNTTDATTDLTTGSTGPISASSTSSSSSTDASSSGSSSGMNCVCTPGDTMGCQGDQILVCADDCSGFEPQNCPANQKCKNDVCTAQLCNPGQKVCEGLDQVKVCNANGDGFEPPSQCGPTQECSGNDCAELCLVVEQTPSSIGCSFFANKMDNFTDTTDSVIVGNTHPTKTASVQLYFVPNGQNVEQAQGGPQMILPGKTYTFQLSNSAINKASQLRVGGVYRISSNIPIIAYQHSPLGAQATNDASMLLPEYALKQNYVIASYKDDHNAYPSYFNVIALQNGTTVKWTPPQNTLSGTGVPAVNAGQTGQVSMNRYDTLQVRGVQSQGDLTGTFITADKPIWVVGAVECVNVPNKNVTFCDHIEEQMLPLDYWGKTYVGAHSPKRGNEKHYWRVFAGEDNVTVSTNPVQPGTPFTINKAQWKELVIPNNTSFIFNCSGPCLPVQYLESQDGGAGTGDPAMYQMIPVEQFLDRYAFATGTGYSQDYVQVIRTKGGADVLVDGVTVNGYYTVDQYEVADWKIAPGGHLAESAQPFGIVSVGYTGVTSYAYPGGMRLQIINPQ